MICSDGRAGLEIPVRPDRHWSCKQMPRVQLVVQKQNCGGQLALHAVGVAGGTAAADAVDMKAVVGEAVAMVDSGTDEVEHPLVA